MVHPTIPSPAAKFSPCTNSTSIYLHHESLFKIMSYTRLIFFIAVTNRRMTKPTVYFWAGRWCWSGLGLASQQESHGLNACMGFLQFSAIVQRQDN